MAALRSELPDGAGPNSAELVSQWSFVHVVPYLLQRVETFPRQLRKVEVLPPCLASGEFLPDSAGSDEQMRIFPS